jgi:hypothetical protein
MRNRFVPRLPTCGIEAPRHEPAATHPEVARGPGQGYVGQLGIADVLAALYFHELL